MALNKTPAQGFTLIEMLVAVSLFVIVVTIAVSALLNIIDANRKAKNISTSANNTFFSMEMMTRLIRTGYYYKCALESDALLSPTDVYQESGDGSNCVRGKDRIYFVDDKNRANVFERYTSAGGVDAIRRRVDTVRGGVWDESYRITSSDFKVENLVFDVTGAKPQGDAGTSEQPAVTITVYGIANVGTPEESPISIQTTVVQRLLDL